MSQRGKDWTKLRSLVERIVDGEKISEEDARRLNEQLLNDDNAREQFLKIMHLEGRLAWTSVLQRQQLPFDKESGVEGIVYRADAEIGSVQPPPLRARVPRRARVSWMVAASVFVAACIGLYNYLANAERGRNVVATLTHSVAAEWSEESSRVPTATNNSDGNNRIYMNDVLELTGGFAEIEFGSGARVVLQAPAKIEFASDNVASLHQGQLYATVPERAQGFAVHTPTSVVTDLGTEFGVAVVEPTAKPASVRAEVHVYKGKVDVQGIANKEAKRQLGKGQAVSVGKMSQALNVDAADPLRFVRELPNPSAYPSDFSWRRDRDFGKTHEGETEPTNPQKDTVGNDAWFAGRLSLGRDVQRDDQVGDWWQMPSAPLPWRGNAQEGYWGAQSWAPVISADRLKAPAFHVHSGFQPAYAAAVRWKNAVGFPITVELEGELRVSGELLRRDIRADVILAVHRFTDDSWDLIVREEVSVPKQGTMAVAQFNARRLEIGGDTELFIGIRAKESHNVADYPRPLAHQLSYVQLHDDITLKLVSPQ